MKNRPQIIVVDDDPPMNAMLCMFIQQQGYADVKGYGSVEELLEYLPSHSSSIIIQDFDLPGLSGLDAIKKIKPAYPDVEFIFLSGQRSIEIAMEAIRYGAFDYLVKDSFAKENVVIKIKNLLRIKELENKRRIFRKLLFILCAIAVISWILIFILYMKGHQNSPLN